MKKSLTLRQPAVLIIGLLIISFTIIVVLLKDIVSVGVVSVIIAWFIGILAILQTQIKKFFFPPLFNFKVEEVLTTTNGGWQEKWYNLVIENNGYSVARNIRVKIRDEEHKSWINLLRPFAGMREDKIFIHLLAVGESEAFNIGHSDSRNDIFELTTNLIPNNQKIRLAINESHTYFIGIVSDNADPVFLKINIENRGYSSMSTSNIKIF